MSPDMKALVVAAAGTVLVLIAAAVAAAVFRPHPRGQHAADGFTDPVPAVSYSDPQVGWPEASRMLGRAYASDYQEGPRP